MSNTTKNSKNDNTNIKCRRILKGQRKKRGNRKYFMKENISSRYKVKKEKVYILKKIS